MTSPHDNSVDGAAEAVHAESCYLFIRWLWWLVILVCLALIATAILPLLPLNWWWVRIGDFPRVQFLIAYLVALLGLILYRRRTLAKVLACFLVIGVGIQIYWIFPYLPIAPLEVQPAESADSSSHLRIVTANVLQENKNAGPLLDLVEKEQPDVLVLCEVNDRWLGDLASLNEQFAFQITHPLENTYGIALYTNLEVVSAEVRTLVRDDIPSIDAHLRLPSGHKVRFFAVHPNPPRPGESTRKRDAELIIVGRAVRDDASAIVLGDLNDVGWSRTTNLFQEVSGLLDPRKGRGLYPTFNANSWIFRYPLDYLFHSDDFRVVKLQILSDIGSDHFPLFVELSREPDATDEQEAPDLDASDLEDAEDAVQDAPSAEPLSRD